MRASFNASTRNFSEHTKNDGVKSSIKLDEGPQTMSACVVPRSVSTATRRDKKRNLSLDLCYTALNAESDLRRVGMPIPNLPAKTNFQGGATTIDFSRVDHTYSLEFDRRSMIDTTATSTNSFGNLFDCVESLSLLQQTTACFFESPLEVKPATKPKPHTAKLNDWTSTTSSVTSEDSDDPSSGAGPTNAEEQSNHHTLSLHVDNIEDARIITTGNEPYYIVHVNPAFTKLTGFSFMRVQGRGIREFLEKPDELVSMLALSGKHMTLGSIAAEGFMLKTYSKKPKYTTCSMTISPIGQPAKSATHIVINLEPCNHGSRTPCFSDVGGERLPRETISGDGGATTDTNKPIQLLG